MPPRTDVPMDQIRAFCSKWKVREFALFGSVLREDFGPQSDIDVLVSFEETAPWSLWDLIDMRDELSTTFGRDVDLIEKEGLRNPFRRHEILQTRQVVYDIPWQKIIVQRHVIAWLRRNQARSYLARRDDSHSGFDGAARAAGANGPARHRRMNLRSAEQLIAASGATDKRYSACRCSPRPKFN